MKGGDLVDMIREQDLWNANVIVAYLYEDNCVVSNITSASVNGSAIQLNEFEFELQCKFRSENE